MSINIDVCINRKKIGLRIKMSIPNRASSFGLPNRAISPRKLSKVIPQMNI
jgi:hypothetical protein